MNGTSLIVTAVISFFSAVIAVVLTSLLAQGREREADWRKLKLEIYKEYILALSGVVGQRTNVESQRRYSDAVNSMSLIAPEKVLRTLQAFQNEISYANRTARTDAKHDLLLSSLFHEIRRDVHPSNSLRSRDYEFHLLGVPPEEKISA